MDLLLAPWVNVAGMRWTYMDNVGSSRALYTQAVETTGFGGDKLRIALEYSPSGGSSATSALNRRALGAFLARMRGRANRAYMTNPGYRQQGSFPTGELLSNPTFANGTSGWTGGSSEITRSVADRVFRATRNSVISAGNLIRTTSAISVTQYAPYVLRMMLMQGRGYTTATRLVFRDSSAATLFAEPSAAQFGMRTFSAVPYVTDVHVSLTDGVSSGMAPGDYIDIPYVSLSRCLLADVGVNLLLRSDEFDNASWAKTRSSVVANGPVDPLGTSTADRLIEDSTASNSHFISQSVTVSSAVADYAFCVAIKAGARTWAELRLYELTGTTAVTQYFDLTNGVLGAGGSGTNFTNNRAFIRSLGSGWWFCAIVGRKTNAATQLDARIYMANANGGAGYTGDGTSDIYLWRATLAQSSVPVRLTQTTTAATSGVSPSGSAMYVKGGPANTSGALLPDDEFEIITSRGSELKIVTAPLDLDAAGLGYLQFEPPLRGTVLDNAPVILTNPMGRFWCPNPIEWDDMPGYIRRASQDFEEAA